VIPRLCFVAVSSRTLPLGLNPAMCELHFVMWHLASKQAGERRRSAGFVFIPKISAERILFVVISLGLY
jgi:hypothetical protein